MKSKWFKLKATTIDLRKSGQSIRDVESELNIPSSSLSGWFKDVELTKSQKKILEQRHQKALIKARIEAVKWHNAQKADRISYAKNEAEKSLKITDIKNKQILEASLAMLYLAEGFKKTDTLGIGNSDPLILKFFIKAVKELYGLERSKIKCELHLRADQNPKEIQRFWSKELDIPLINFTSVSVDNRTKGRPTYKDYRGVCVLRCSNLAIQRKLVYFGIGFCQKTIEKEGD